MLKKPSQEWNDYVERLTGIKKKSNREVLWTQCWMILNYEQRGKHSSKFPKHKESILTSSQFASEIQFYHIAFTHNKVVEKSDGNKLIIQPCLFDPKKGVGHMKMIEDLCREMHSPMQTSESVARKASISINAELAEKDERTEKLVYSWDSKLPQESKRIHNVDTSLNFMISDLCEFENDVFNQINSSFNLDRFIPQFQNQQNMRISINSFQRRKTSESDSFSNWKSAETTIPNMNSEVTSLHSNSPSLYPQMKNYKGFSINTAFTPVQQNQKQKKILKPIPLPTLNHISAQMPSF